METQILEPCIFVKGRKANILQDADFFNIVETLQMALGSIGPSCSGTGLTDGDLIVSRNAHSHPADISSVRAQNFENSLIQQFSRGLPHREVEVLKR